MRERLIHASDFCQLTSSFAKKYSNYDDSDKRRIESNENEINEKSKNDSTSINSQGINQCVAEDIITEPRKDLPCPSHIRKQSKVCGHILPFVCDTCGSESIEQANNIKDDESKISGDLFSTVYTDSIELFRLLEIIQGSSQHICILSSSSSWAPVLLRLFSNGCGCKKVQKRGCSQTNFNVYIPPCVAATAGIYDYIPVSLKNITLSSTFSNHSDSMINIQKSLLLKRASTAIIQEVNPYPCTYNHYQELLHSSAYYLNNKKSDKEKQEIDVIQSFFKTTITKSHQDQRESNFTTSLSIPRLVKIGSIFAVCPVSHSFPEGKHVEKKVRSLSKYMKLNQVRFYTVCHCASENMSLEEQAKQREKNNAECFIISPKFTKLILSSSSSPPSKKLLRLPQISFASLFFRSAVNTHTDLCSSQLPPPVTPSVKKLINVFLSMSKDMFLQRSFHSQQTENNNHTLLHVNGIDEIYTRYCIEHTCDIMGARYKHINGLASHQYCSSSLKKKGKDSATSNASTSALSYRMNGIQSLIQEIVHSSSFSGFVVLHISDFHTEISTFSMSRSSIQNLDTLQEEECKKLIQYIQQALSKVKRNIFICVVLTTILSTGKPSNIIVNKNCCISRKQCNIISNALRSSSRIGFCYPTIDIHFTSSLSPGASQQNNNIENAHIIAKYFLNSLYSCKVHEINGGFDQALSNILAFIEKNQKTITFNQVISKCMILWRGNNQDINYLPHTRTKEKNNTNTMNPHIPNVQWDDIGGLSHVRSQITNVIEIPLLMCSSQSSNSAINGGNLLFYGPPGTGKTLVAKAIATQYNLPFLSIKGPELLGAYVGESEANVRKVFQKARSLAKQTKKDGNNENTGGAILFFDELDSLAPKRGEGGDSGSGGVMERIVSTLLTELDKKSTSSKSEPIIFVIAATNRPDLLEPSLLRPGRLDKLVYLGFASTIEMKEKILCALMRKFSFEKGLTAQQVVQQVFSSLEQSVSCLHLTGADLSFIATTALMASIRRKCEEVEEEVLRQTSARNTNSSNVPNDSLSMTEMIDIWEKKNNVSKLEPVVTILDIQEATRQVVPSVSQKERLKYELLRKKFEEKK